MLNKEFVRRKIALIEDELSRLTEFENLTLKEAAEDFKTQAVVERLLERIIGRALDVNQHIIAEKGAHLKSVTRYRETFLRLAELGVYPPDFAAKIAPSAGFRNALVHDYNDIDPDILQKSVGEAIREYNEYAGYVLAFIERE